MKRFVQKMIGVVGLVCVFASDVCAVTYELRGVGTLPSFGTQPAGVVGENITVSVMLDSDDFYYRTVANPTFHYFEPNTTVPVRIVGSITGEYPNVSPISRFLALELTDEPNVDDQLALDVAFGNGTTSLLTVYSTGVDGFDGDVTPFTPTELFTLFAEAMQNQAVWNRSTNAAVFIGSSDDLLYLGDLDWSLVDPDEPPVQQLSIEPTFDVQLKPGNTYPLGNATTTTLDIDGGSGTSFPVLDVLLDFPLSDIPAGAQITSAKLKLDATSSSSTMTIQALGYEGDGLASLSDEFAATSLIGSKAGPFTTTGDITIDLNTQYIESLVDTATHLGLRLKSATTGPFVRIATSEHTTGVPPTLVLEYTTSLPGDFDSDGDVDGRDFLAWQRNPSVGDLADWQANYGVGSLTAAMSVPEPAATWLLYVPIVVLGKLRRFG